MPEPSLRELLDAAVVAVGGVERPGQVAMADAVSDAMDTGEHLLVQAGTGTGKSLAYLVPAVRHAMTSGSPVVVATATLALQSQIVDRDLPRVADALAPLLPRRPTYAILKGRANYLCRWRVEGGVPDEAEALFAPSPTTALGRDVVRLREWAEQTETGDRDEVVPGVQDRAWRQLSVSARECVGASRCPNGDTCFAERARAAAADVDVVVTNHALLAIDAMEGLAVLPDHDVVVVDEAHELVDRVTGVATAELTPALVERAVKRSFRLLPDDNAADLDRAASGFVAALAEVDEGRLDRLPEVLIGALGGLHEVARSATSALQREKDGDGSRKLARAALDQVFDVCERLLAEREDEVIWLTRTDRRGPALHVAPLSVAGLLRSHLFADATLVLTSATLELGGSFDAVAGALGLAGTGSAPYRAIDVGSPFDYGRQAMLYVAAHLPTPGRDGVADAALDELADLLVAAGGRCLGLFSSMRAAQRAAEVLRPRVDLPILCQGEDGTGELVRRFAADARACLFGTLSLWQGVDVPGSSLQLVVIDRIPFPRPDDPLMSARARAADRAGGNGFMSVAAAHAALLLAQGSGRLIRTDVDRGVVAVLDPRLHSARYASFLRASLPPFWYTTDPLLVRKSLASIDAAAPPVRPVAPRRTAGSVVAVEVVAAPVAWSPADDELLRRSLAGGEEVDVVAAQFGCSVDAVLERVAELGLEESVQLGFSMSAD